MMPEVEWGQFVYANKKKKAWDTFYEAEHNVNHPLHQLATCTKMSRERLKGVFMAIGKDRNFAEGWLDDIREQCGSYFNWWYHKAPDYVYILDCKIRKQNRKKWFTELFNAKIAESIEVERQRKNREQLKSDFEELKAIAEKYPELTDKSACHKARVEALLSASEPTGEKDENGCDVLRMNTDKAIVAFEKIEAIRKLENYFVYGEGQ